MGKCVSLIGKKFNRLTVVKRVIKNNDKHIYYLCKCDCGGEKIVRQDHLSRNNIVSCGCYNREQSSIRCKYLGKQNVKHNLSHSRLYRIYAQIKTRCYNAKSPNFKYYGARGIKVCNEWLGENGFLNFYNWATNNGYDENLSIDRINVDRNYEPSNCKWSDNVEQANNKRNNHYVFYKGNKVTISQLSRMIKINRDVLYDRINNLQWCLNKAVNTPIRPKKQKGSKYDKNNII